ncbi:beta-galactosidase [Verrucomicrobium sp. BvORR034]|uniref:beta-galactosidase n=1 Tax=Verrucomicrobium sp. BvORR034 TaxID=1396418 RepID=UPI000679AF92|nr:beta-galactosidase [Verrucomicrobium sp. BvORR034]
MHRSLATFLVWTTLCSGAAYSASFKFVNEGLEIDAGNLGRLTLEYPQLLDAGNQPLHKVVETTISGKTVKLRYAGGGVAEVTLGNDGKLSCKVTQIPADVKNIGTSLQLPIAYNQGGSWKMGDKSGEFPKSKPASPHLYQGHAPELALKNYEGRTLTVQVPDNSFLQLSDNREWNWSIFHWHSFTPYDVNKPEFVYGIVEAGAVAVAKPLVDSFGQSTREEWADKVKSLEELKADVAAEKKYYDSLNPPATDEYGGLPGSKEKLGLKATGYFRVEKKGDRWILVNPLGNAFFHLGLCVVNPNDDYTLVKGRETAYEWLPKPEGEYASVFRPGSNGTILSYHLVNQVRKYGEPYSDESYTARMIGRMKRWGFNSIGAFSNGGEKARATAKFPTVAHLPINVWEGVPRISGIHETFDPFDEKTRAMIEANMARELPAKAKDPLIIGYFIVNEPIYEQIPHVVPSLKGSEHACKRELVKWLQNKYQSIGAFNKAWEANVASFDALLEVGLTVTAAAAKADAEAFATHFLDEYLKLVKTSFRKHDPNHLLIGSRLQPGTISHEWICRAMGPHLDVMSYNYYTYGVDKDHLRKVYEWTGGLPMMLSEFFWSSPKDSGLDGGREVGSQQERGLMYRNYVEQSASLGFVIGTEWFTLVDQSVTGRWFSGFDGERSNSGIISVTDRPWKPLLEEMMKTNYDIYRVWFGEREPFSYSIPGKRLVK